MVRSGYYPSENDINCIFRRIDIDRDGKISLDDFKKIVTYQNYSSISGLKNEELNHNIQLQNSKQSIYESYNQELSSRNFDLKLSSNSLKNAKEKINYDYEHHNKFKDSKVLEKSFCGDTGNYQITTLEKEYRKGNPKSCPKRKNQIKSSSNQCIGTYSRSIDVNSNTFIKTNYILLEEEAFQQFLKDIIIMTNEVELIKRDLAICHDFNTLDSFKYFQANERDFLFSTDIKNGLSILEIPYAEDEVDYLIKRFDIGKNRIIT